MVIVNSFEQPESNIRLREENVRVILDKNDIGLGTLVVSESSLCWQQKDNIGFSIGYPNISLHAISNDLNIHPKECLFIIVDGRITMPGDVPQQISESSNEDDSDSVADISELLLIPNNEVIIPVIYEVIKICQELNPDPTDVDDEDDNLYEDAEDDDDMEEGEYHVAERGGGDADVEDLSTRMQDNSVNFHYGFSNGNDEEEFQDAD